MVEQEKGVAYVCHHLNNALAISIGAIRIIENECECPDLKKQTRHLKRYIDYLVRTTRYIDRHNLAWEDIKIQLKKILSKFANYVRECVWTIEHLVCL